MKPLLSLSLLGFNPFSGKKPLSPDPLTTPRLSLRRGVPLPGVFRLCLFGVLLFPVWLWGGEGGTPELRAYTLTRVEVHPAFLSPNEDGVQDQGWVTAEVEVRSEHLKEEGEGHRFLGISLFALLPEGMPATASTPRLLHIQELSRLPVEKTPPGVTARYGFSLPLTGADLGDGFYLLEGGGFLARFRGRGLEVPPEELIPLYHALLFLSFPEGPGNAPVATIRAEWGRKGNEPPKTRVELKLRDPALRKQTQSFFEGLILEVEAQLKLRSDHGDIQLVLEAIASYREVGGFVVDRVPPQVEIFSPLTGTWYKSLTLLLLARVQDPGSGVDPSGITVTLDNTTMSEGFTLTNGELFEEFAFLEEGEHTLLLTVRDQAGNRTEVGIPFGVDRTPPLFLEISPPSPAYRNDPFAPVLLRYTDLLSGINPSTSQLIVAGNAFSCSEPTCGEVFRFVFPGGFPEGVFPTYGVVEDRAGNRAETLPLLLVQDYTPPEILRVFPSPQGLYGEALATLEVFAVDNLSPLGGIESTLDGREITGFFVLGETGAQAFLPQPLGDGDHLWWFRIADLAGNMQEQVIPFSIDTLPPHLTVSPPDGAILTSNRVELHGTVEEPHLRSLRVQGVEIPVSSQGQFSTPVALITGANTVVVEAEDTLGHRTVLTLHWILTSGEGPLITFYGVEDQAIYRDNPPANITVAYFDPDGVDVQSLEVYYDFPFPLSPEQRRALEEAGITLPLPYFAYFRKLLREFYFRVNPNGTEAEFEALYQGYRNQHIGENFLRLPQPTSGEGFFVVCVEARDLLGNSTRRCVSWATDLFAPLVQVVPPEGFVVVPGSGTYLKVRAYDPSAFNFLFGAQRGPTRGFPLSGDCCTFILNGQDLTAQFQRTGEEEWVLATPTLNPENTLRVTVRDFAHAVTVERHFSARTLGELMAGVSDLEGLTPSLALSLISLIPNFSNFPEFSGMEPWVFRTLFHRVRGEIGLDEAILLKDFVENPSPEIDDLTRVQALQVLALAVAMHPDPRLDEWLVARFKEGSATAQMAILSTRSFRPPERALPLTTSTPPHILVQYLMSGFRGIHEIFPEGLTSEPPPETGGGGAFAPSLALPVAPDALALKEAEKSMAKLWDPDPPPVDPYPYRGVFRTNLLGWMEAHRAYLEALTHAIELQSQEGGTP